MPSFFETTRFTSRRVVARRTQAAKTGGVDFPTTTIVFAEGSWTMEEPNERLLYGRTFGTAMGAVRWDRVGEGLGLQDALLGGAAQDPWGNTKAGFSASTEIDREQFGLTWNQALETGGVLVGKNIKIEIEVQAVQG